ncbi:MAG TPA: PEP-CTERM sorting domain-containing protein [Gemmatimonadaceae bacterium]|jgi:hypothetical protein
MLAASLPRRVPAGVVLTALLFAAPTAAAQATFTACAQPTQFQSASCRSSGPTLTPVEVSEHGSAMVGDDAARTTRARSSAGPYGLAAESFAENAGITVSQATARWESGFIDFAPSPELLALLAPGETQLELLLNFATTASLSSPPPPGIFRQGVASVHGIVTTRSYGHASTMTGSAQIVNGPVDHGFTNSGFLDDLPEAGGSATFSLPVRLTPGMSQGLRVGFGAFASASVLSEAAPGSAALWISLLEGDDAITLRDGTPVSAVGVTYTFTPARLDAPPETTVPEPGTVALVAGGLLALGGTGSWRRRRRR